MSERSDAANDFYRGIMGTGNDLSDVNIVGERTTDNEHHHLKVVSTTESLDFDEMESIMWRKVTFVVIVRAILN